MIMAALIALCCFAACQKKDDMAVDTSKVITNITSPVNGAIYHNGDTVHIVADVAYPSELHGYEIEITDTSNGNILFTADDHVHTDHFSIDEHWVGSTLQPKGLRLRIITSIDHNGNKATKERYFSLQP